MKEGTSTTSFSFKYFTTSNYTILANRAVSYLAMAIVEIIPNKDIEISANNYMVIPDELKEAKSQFRVLKDNQYMMPVFGMTAKTLTGNYTLSAVTTFLF